MKNPREIGKCAENRVVEIALSLGFQAFKSCPEDDYGGGKTDVIINGILVQVSCQPKSNGQREKLSNKGVVNIAAGENYTDNDVAAAILKLFS